MKRIPVYLRDMYDAKHLVQIAGSCQGNVDLICGRYVVDAKSMLGVFSLPAFDQVELEVREEEEEVIREKLESFLLIRKYKTELQEENHAIKKSENEKACTGA